MSCYAYRVETKPLFRTRITALHFLLLTLAGVRARRRAAPGARAARAYCTARPAAKEAGAAGDEASPAQDAARAGKRRRK